MKADAIATRMSVLGRALPSRVLLVDDDELELELMADRLAAAGFEVARAANGEAALQLIEQQWYPLVITDWLMPVMDGIAFTEALRGRGATDTYIIMLTMREASVDYERGYVAGVDDYLSKRVPDAELFARITAAFNTLALRRSLKEAQAALEQAAAIDTESGAFALRELYTQVAWGDQARPALRAQTDAADTGRVRSRARDCGRSRAVAGDPARHRADDRKRRADADRLDRSARQRTRRCVRRRAAGIQHQRSAAHQGAAARGVAPLCGRLRRVAADASRSASLRWKTRASRARPSTPRRCWRLPDCAATAPGTPARSSSARSSAAWLATSRSSAGTAMSSTTSAA